MNKLRLLITFSLYTTFIQAQDTASKKQMLYNEKLSSNILRISVTEPLAKDYETNTILFFSYERKLRNAFTMITKIGGGLSIKNASDVTQKSQLSIHAVGLAELRYYFTILRQINRGKYVKNYSSPYISLEQNFFSNAIWLRNQNTKDAVQGSTNSFLNLGCQAQSKRIYFGAYFGVRLGGKSYSNFGDESVSNVHGGISIGYVF